MRIDTAPADYLIHAAREPLLRIFWDRGNAPLESSQLRLALAAHGIKADDARHWGLFFMALKNTGVLQSVGRERAAASSRNDAWNRTHQLTPEMWAYVQLLAERRGWPAPIAATETKATPEQTALVSAT